MPEAIKSKNCDYDGTFKEAVCIDADRVYDSCSDKDCLENLCVYFNDESQTIINSASNVKVKNVQVLYVCTDVENVPFNKGFYSVDMTFYFNVNVDVYSTVCQQNPANLNGLAIFAKKVILYGSDGSVRSFSSDRQFCCSAECVTLNNASMPIASVKVVDPIVLSSTLCDTNTNCNVDVTQSVPGNILCFYNGTFGTVEPTKFLCLTLGMFSIVQIKRDVQMMIPSYDFCLPDKECVTGTEDPCELFNKIKFPSNEFFPPNLNDEEDCG